MRYLLLLRAEGSRLGPEVRADIANDVRRATRSRFDGLRELAWVIALLACPVLATGFTFGWRAAWLSMVISPLLACAASKRYVRWSRWRRDMAAFRLETRLPLRSG